MSYEKPILPDPANYFSGIEYEGMLPRLVTFFERRRAERIQGNRTIHHARFNLIHCVKGRGAISLEDNILELGPGKELLIFPFQNHYYLGADKDIQWFFAGFDHPLPERLISLKNRIVRGNRNTKSQWDYMLEAYEASLKGLWGGNTAVLCLGQILEEMGRILTSEKRGESPLGTGTSPLSPGDRDFLNRVQRIIYRSLEEPVDVGGVSRELGVSSSQLQLRFKRLMNVSLGRYIRETKIAHGGGLLCSSNATLAEVAARLGYSSEYAFGRAFKGVTGFSPGDFRRKQT